MFVNFKSGFVLDINPGIWREMFRWPVEERIRRLRDDPALRQRLKDDLKEVDPTSMLAFISRIDTFVVRTVIAEKNKKYEGRVVGDIAREGNCHPLDIM